MNVVVPVELLPGDDDSSAEAEGSHMAAGQGGLKRFLMTFVENRLALVGVAIVVLVVLFCYLGPHLYHTDQLNGNLLSTDLEPSSQHLLGTDDQGHDILGRLMVGGQSSLELGLAVAVGATLIGVLWGAIAGFIGGFVDTAMMRVVDVLLSIPSIFLFIYLGTVFRPTLLLLILVLSFISWLVPARLVRGETLSLRTREYVQAVRVMGGGGRRIILRHIVPNAIGTIVVNATFQIADAILALATLSFLGFGLPPPAVTWGGMLSQGTNYLADGYWWEVYPVGLILVITVVAFNFIGDSLRDAFEVRLHRR